MAGTGNRLSPRQKMINLMYIVLTAMLALNVSSDVLDGFTQVNDGLNRSNENVEDRNAAIYSYLEAAAIQNPEKGGIWLDRATEVRRHTAEMVAYIDSLKTQIVHTADGPDGDPANVLNRDDLEAAAVVMLSPGDPQGTRLRERLNSYRDFIGSFINDPRKLNNINKALNTDETLQAGTIVPKSWEEIRFEQQPVVAAITLLAKLQNDILFAEGEALTSLLSQVDAGDVRVNALNAYVIPDSRLVMRGGKYTADIILAAVDTTALPTVYVSGKQLPNDRGRYELNTGSTGTFSYDGYIEVAHGDGTIDKLPFSSSYTVIEPMATVSATMMNVLYAGIDNPISISVPGVPMSAISANMTNGTLSRNGDTWIARPSGVGKEAVLTVTATIDGRQTNVANTSFRIRKLPDPTAFIAYTEASGNTAHYKGGRGFPKASLLAAAGLDAAIDDGLLDTKFTVTGFETVFFDSMGNAIPEQSAGARFSERQKQQFQRLSRGKRFYISRIKAVGPDGITRDLAPMEVIVN
ncbi:MAG: gliding motility protein GldM [Muribaculaceae bacterium]|nr:gliding motility protein GldM [Muribaculaceae bacterium]